jgi:hypothetical protein
MLWVTENETEQRVTSFYEQQKTYFMLASTMPLSKSSSAQIWFAHANVVACPA